MDNSDYLAHRSSVLVGPMALHGYLAIPDKVRGVIVFAHGSGSSRDSPRNRHVAEALHARNFGTLLLDLLSEEETHDRKNVFDISLLSERVQEALRWIDSDSRTQHRLVGLLGASTGAAAALMAAADMPGRVSAVVSRGGRPDLAKAALGKVRAPTLLIVGGVDTKVLDFNRDALQKLTCIKRLEIIPRATHLFEESGAMDKVIEATARWFDLYLIQRATLPSDGSALR